MRNTYTRKCAIVAIASVVLISLVLGLTLAIPRGLDATLLALSGPIALAVLALPLLARSRFDPFEPLSIVLLMGSIGVTFKLIAIAGPDNSRIADFVLLDRPLEFLTPTMFIVILGFLAFSLGYSAKPIRLPVRRLWLFTTDEWRWGRFAIVLILSLVIATICLRLYMSLMSINIIDLNTLSSKRFYVDPEFGERHGTLSYLIWGGRLVEYSFYLTLGLFYARKSGWLDPLRIVLIVTGAFAILIPVLISSRASIGVIVLNALLLRHFLRGRLTLRFAAGGGALFMILFFFVSSARSDTIRDLTGIFDLSGLLDQTVGGRHFLDVAKTAHIIEAVPEQLEYQYGTTFVSWVVVAIPRVVWKDKPFFGAGHLLGREVFRTARRNGVPPGLMGELALNFGAWAIPFGMFVAGLLLNSFYATFEPVLRTRDGAIIYAMLLYPMTFTLLNNQFGQAMVGAILNLAPMLVMLGVVKHSKATFGHHQCALPVSPR